MKTFNKKKGFTIVELVIVIAVIGVLTAVLVPTFVNLVNKANQASDESLIKNLNTQLRMKEQTEGKNPTLTDALLDAKEAGYLVENLTPKGGRDIVWNQDKDEFGFGDEAKGDLNRYWKIYEKAADVPSVQTYSIYAKGTEWAGDLSYTVGFDAGENEGITSISYLNATSSAKKVTVRTNGGTFMVNAPLDTVAHYGEGVVLDVRAIAGASYHEYGYFPKALIAQGRIVVEEEGNIPAVEVTAVPTDTNPIQIETDKDIVVFASEEVVEELGGSQLENVDVTVTDASAQVVVDEAIDAANVEAAGKTEEDLVTITKVKNLSELLTAVAGKKSYIMFADNIHTDGTENGLINLTYSVTLDGNGYTLDGDGGLRGSTKQMIVFGFNAPARIEKIVVRNLNIETTSVTRALECRGNTDEIVLESVTMNATGPSNDQGFTFGGNDNKLMKLTVKNCDLAIGGDGYTFIFFNAVDMLIENSTITGWAGLYFKSPSSSHGSRGSKVMVKNSAFVCHNENWGVSNAFGAIVFEDGDVDVTLIDSSIDVTQESDQEQTAVLFNSGWASYYGTYLKNGHVVFKGDCSVNGTINCVTTSYDLTNDVKIEGGTYTSDPTDYVPAGHTVSRKGSLYIVK